MIIKNKNMSLNNTFYGFGFPGYYSNKTILGHSVSKHYETRRFLVLSGTTSSFSGIKNGRTLL